ncbi:two-component system, OmpR family, phosphate regulon sensor histidine kinase PhoR [Geobacteraceae bacterium]|nr:two-component system, OmpR family, phosphate regulon sensor histidine kinase PhoR [Geobacteraceae bacterium]
MEPTAGKSTGDILIIEDSPTQSAQLRHILETNGYRVISAGNGKEALALIPGQKPSLIISDIIMPGLDGYELCRRIKEREDCRDIPVILLTSLSDPHDVIRGLECGADNFITKPCNEEHLLSRVRHLLENRNPCQVEARSGLEIHFAGERYCITADRRQILDLLLCTYETAIQKNNELIRAQNELNSLNKQLETANRELEAFNYTVSHDLRSPLTNISGYCQVLLELHADTLDLNCVDYIQEIFQATHRMNDLIGDLMEFSRLNHQELKRQEVNLSAIARIIAAELQTKDKQRRVDFKIGEGIIGNGDSRLLHLVLVNLLGNAWKYTGRKESAEIEFGVMEAAGKQVYFVRDNGAGFDMTEAHRLFGTFQRLHTKLEFEGTGIGLATVQRIIQRHGGTIWGEGEIGKGATFYFSLEPEP